jgi:hypothetical protein
VKVIVAKSDGFIPQYQDSFDRIPGDQPDAVPKQRDVLCGENPLSGDQHQPELLTEEKARDEKDNRGKNLREQARRQGDQADENPARSQVT